MPTPHRRPVVATITAAALLAAIVAANYLTAHYGFIPVGFGLTATAGTLMAGAFLALRDLLNDNAGRWTVVAVIAAGAVLSWFASTPSLALASSAAFLLAELADFSVYSPLRRRSTLGDRRWTAAVVASNLVGAIVDSLVFLLIAFGTVQGTLGQLVGKGWATVAYLFAGFVVAAVLRARRTPAAA